MLAPGATFTAAGRLAATIGAATVPTFFNEGIGYMANGNLAMDTDAPAGTVYDAGFRQSAAGALYVTVTPAGTDVYNVGIRISNLGQLVIESADPTSFSNRNPVTAAGLLAVN